MPEFAPAIYLKAAAAIERELMSGTYYDTHVESEEALARVALDAVAADLGQHVAAKILASYDEIAPGGGLTRRGEQDWHERRKCYRAAARVAALAFLADDEAPEDSDEH